MTTIKQGGKVFAEASIDGLECRLELACHRYVQLADDGAQVERCLFHVGDLRGEELIASARLLILLGRVGIAASQSPKTTAQCINTPA